MKLRWRFVWFVVYPIAKVILGVRVLGRKYLKQTGGKIIAANHTSNFDPIILGLATGHEIYFLAKIELFSFRKWFSWLIQAWNAFPVRRSAIDIGLFKTCSRLLQKNRTLILFPEGSRNKNVDLLPFKPGIGFLAVTNSVPVIPCHIYGTKESFISKIVDPDINPGKIRLGDFFSSRITIKFGSPIPPNGFSKNRKDYENFTSTVQKAVEQLK